jgi:ubiquinol-cytochrome c reductase iron-sulfur subunit
VWQPHRSAAYGVKFPDMGDVKRQGPVEDRKLFSYFIGVIPLTAGAVFVKNLVTDFVWYLGPPHDVIATSNIEIDVSKVPEGDTLTFKWRGKPLFVRHRTPEEIASVRNVPPELMKDPEPDSVRAKKPEYLIVLGICTHLGCVPLKNQGDYNGWFCPCHGSHYDASGRIRRGPAPRNLEVPPYVYLSDTRVLVGVNEIPK